MSQRPPSTAIEAARQKPTRRVVLQGSLSSTLLFPSPPAVDAAAAVGAVWLARNFECQRLARQWAALEARLQREHDWLNLPRAARARFPEQAELDAISAREDELDNENLAAIIPLAKLKAVSWAGFERKLEVALAVHPVEENEDGHRLIKSILRDFRALHTSAR